MIGLILGIGIPAGYLVTGWLLALLDLPRQWRASRLGSYNTQHARQDVLLFFTMMFLFWPVFLACRGVAATFNRAIDSRDPERPRELEYKRLRLQIEGQRRLEDMEREAGLRD